MTREQDLERQLAEWLVYGPSTAPVEVVDEALKRTAGRPQERGIRRLLAQLGRWFQISRVTRVSALAAVLAGVLLTSVIVSAPFLGGGTAPSPTPTLGPAPSMDGQAALPVAGIATMVIESESPMRQVRSVVIDTGDPRVDGRASQDLVVLAEAANAAQLHGTMQLTNDWGAWNGQIDIVRYPSGEEYEYASLRGTDAYAGYSYAYTVHQATAEAERTVEAAIWPDEPPPLPDPSLLP